MTTRRLLEVEYRRGEEVVVHFRPSVLRGCGGETLRHWRNSNREFLLAVRSLLDGAINWVTPTEAKDQERRGRRRQRVNVTEEENA